MSAATPLPAVGVTTADKRYEPSMEEILASIRRIIADDQTLPGKAPEPAPPTNLHQPVVPPAPTPFAAPAAPQEETVVHAPMSVEPAAATIEQRAHGIVAAPQFVAPDGPSADHVPPRETRPAAEALHMSEPAPRAPEAQVQPPETYDEIEEDVDFYESAIEPTPAVPTNAVYEDVQEAQAPARQDEPVHNGPPASLFSAATDTSLTSAFNMLAASRLADNSDELMNLAREMIRPLLRSWIDDNLPSMVERMVRAEIERVARGGR